MWSLGLKQGLQTLNLAQRIKVTKTQAVSGSQEQGVCVCVCVVGWEKGYVSPTMSPRWSPVQVGRNRLLALLTGVFFACLICSRLFLKFCLGKMAECMEFQDYLQAGVHDSVREGTPAASWAKAKMRLTKSLRHLGDSRSQWLQTFASASRFGGTEDVLIENLIGYTLTEQVQINMTTGAFEKIRVQSETVSETSDPALISLLEGQAALIKSLTEKVNSLSEAPTRSEKSVPPLCLKELHDLAL